MQKHYPTRDRADADLDDYITSRLRTTDANDLLYAVDSSRNYDPSAKLEEITVPVMFVNSADDQINPPELGIAQREIKRVKKGQFVLLPITDETRGHGTIRKRRSGNNTSPNYWRRANKDSAVQAHSQSINIGFLQSPHASFRQAGCRINFRFQCR